MTALAEYDRLEATALWRRSPADQRREVLVTLGEATLTIAEFSGAILTHWSIPAVRRGPASKETVVYHPDGDPGETLEFAASEATMIAAIDRLLGAVERRRPHPGKLRLILATALVAILGLSAVVWLPGAVQAYAARVVPPAQKAEIGRVALDHLYRVTGAPCAAREARAPLDRFARRVLGPDAVGTLIVVPTELRETAHLPGPLFLLGRSVFEDHEDPEVAAGFLIAEAERAETQDALAAMLQAGGFIATLRFLTTGALPDSALQAYTETLLTQDPAPLAPEPLLARFAAADIRSTPYAYALDPTGETTLALIEADPFASTPPRPVLSDADWVRLQGICGN